MLTDDHKQWIGHQMQAMEERLSEKMRDMQTELLKAFLPGTGAKSRS